MALCYQCFREKGAETVCPFCGYDPTGSAKKHPMALRPESILNGRYILGRVLGQGGFGITYIAQDYQTKERVAVKEYFPTEFAGRTNGTHVQIYSEEREAGFAYGKAQFLEEARTLAAVTGSENIVRIHSYFEENGTAYFTMDYVEGLPLDEYLKTRGARLKAAEAAALLLPLMGALDTVHRKGIVHRDIAPDNIIISPEGKARLIDFGAARYSTGEKSKSLDVILKHGFAPMEQYTRRGRQGPWTDVYAMAATYYFALTGKVPPDAIERIAEDTLEPPSALGSDLSAGEEQVLLKGLAVQAPERWQTMGEFRAALQAVRGAIDAETRRAEQERKTREERERKAREKAEREKQEKAAPDLGFEYEDEKLSRMIGENFVRLFRELLERLVRWDTVTLPEFNAILEIKFGKEIYRNRDYYAFLVHLAKKDRYRLAESFAEPETFLESYVSREFSEEEKQRFKDLTVAVAFGEEEVELRDDTGETQGTVRTMTFSRE